MLRPQDTAFRETKNLDGLWNFRVDHLSLIHIDAADE